jgi:hypothetical protein
LEWIVFGAHGCRRERSVDCEIEPSPQGIALRPHEALLKVVALQDVQPLPRIDRAHRSWHVARHDLGSLPRVARIDWVTASPVLAASDHNTSDRHVRFVRLSKHHGTRTLDDEERLAGSVVIQ